MAVKLTPLATTACALVMMCWAPGCTLIPETRHRDRIHNPFPQLKRVAVLPFFNQSSEPTVDTDLVAESYYAALQAVPGFEVLPVGVAKAQWLQYSRTHGEPRTGAEFQKLARQMGVEAIVVGSVTDFDAYYPPRMAMTVHWYAANEGFHPIPAGYGLPWGTKHQDQIPRRIAREAEFELARSQLTTQTPQVASGEVIATAAHGTVGSGFDVGSGVQINNRLRPSNGEVSLQPPAGTAAANPFTDPFGDGHLPAPPELSASGNTVHGAIAGDDVIDAPIIVAEDGTIHLGDLGPPDAPLPPDWPDSTDLIPDPPSPVRPVAARNHRPVLTHTKLYRGDDSYFTTRLADYVETGDDARPGGWQGYLKRSEDFVRFCCHLHIAEMLESRGGSEQSDLILRWPWSRY